MGLESVEFVIQVEESLGINISDDVYSHSKTVGQFTDFIVQKHFSDIPKEGYKIVSDAVKNNLIKNFNIKEDQIKPESSFLKDFGFD